MNYTKDFWPIFIFKIKTAFGIGVFVFLWHSGCEFIQPQKSDINYYTLPAFNKKGVTAVVEIPAGTNHKIEYQPTSNTFENDQLHNRERVINFLPYPANYGFIPSTLMATSRGGDGDALDILILSESKPTGSVMPVLPIATLLLKDSDELDTKIIAIPADFKDRIIEADGFQTFMLDYDAVRRIIETWFLNYKNTTQVELIGWRDADYAIEEIRKWEVK